MEEKKSIKISLSTLFLILAIIAIIVMGIFIYKLYNERNIETEKAAELQSQVSSLNGTVSDLQSKINSISKTINSSTSNKTNTDNKSNNNKTYSNQLSTENTIKELFLAKLKEINNSNPEKLLDYRVDKVEILSNSKKQSLMELGYTSDDILAYVTYSVKPKNVNTSNWMAGNGKIEGKWITNKVACACLRNGKLINELNTGW